MSTKQKISNKGELRETIELNQGDWVQLFHEENLFQVIGIDSEHKRCWIRQWPLLPKGSPVFEISTNQISGRLARSK